MKNPLDNRAVTALAVVAASIVLLMCLVSYGPAEFAGSGQLSLLASIGRPLVWLAGTGAYALVLVPLTWGVIVYFREDTPDLVMRGIGTVALAATTAIVAGLFAGPAQHTLGSGFIGHEAALFIEGWGGLGTTVAWLLVLAAWFASLMLSTDFLFHRVRRDPNYFVSAPARKETTGFAVEPQHTAFREDPSDLVADMVVGLDVTPADSADLLEDEAAVEHEEILQETLAAPTAEPLVQPHPASNAMVQVPEGWSSHDDGGRTVLRGPSGYRGVEFLEPNDELALPEPDPIPEMIPEGGAAVLLFEEEFVDDSLPSAHDDIAEEGDVHEALTDEIALPEELLAQLGEAEEDELSAATPEAATPEGATTEDAREGAGPDATEQEPAGIGYPEDSSIRDEVFELQHGEVVDFVPGFEDVDLSSFGHESELAQTFPAEEPEPAAVDEPEAVPTDAPTIAADVEPAEETDPTLPVSRLPAETDEETESEPDAPFTEPGQHLLFEEVLFSDVDVSMFEDVMLTDESPPEPEAEPVLVHAAAPAAQAYAEAPPVEAPAASPAPVQSAHPALQRVLAMDVDPLFHDGVDAVLGRGRASAVALQRSLGVGYSRGLRMLDQMTQAGLIGPDSASGAREILIDRTIWEEFTGRPVR